MRKLFVLMIAALPLAGMAPPPAAAELTPAMLQRPEPDVLNEVRERLGEETEILRGAEIDRELLQSTADVYSSISHEFVGDVDSVIVEDGEVAALVLDFGDFIGVGGRTLTVDADKLLIVRTREDVARVYIQATEAQLKEMTAP